MHCQVRGRADVGTQLVEPVGGTNTAHVGHFVRRERLRASPATCAAVQEASSWPDDLKRWRGERERYVASRGGSELLGAGYNGVPRMLAVAARVGAMKTKPVESGSQCMLRVNRAQLDHLARTSLHSYTRCQAATPLWAFPGASRIKRRVPSYCPVPLRYDEHQQWAWRWSLRASQRRIQPWQPEHSRSLEVSTTSFEL